ncbi:phage tail tube protein [Chromobacterium vaccinii]|uniref:phage tail tube protein n=1 Tax=Chromobacterium TaxID=535 RepID=UPI0007F8FA24|nr:phage tail tube protein [Chromobacterium subtsugae]OBU85868.1 phage tail protein [Chromobacterium subtsugae]
MAVDNTYLLAGTCQLSVNGTSYMVAGDFGYSPAKVKRETKAGRDGVHGYSETPIPGFIKAKLRDSGNLTVAELSTMTNVTVTLQLANGKTVVGRNMWTVESPEVDSVEAEIDVRWEGMSVEEA